MSYIAVKDLKNSRSLREKLKKERELILTKDGQPFGLIIGITADDLEDSLREVRRAMFSKAIARARKKAAASPVDDTEIDQVVAKSRKSRGLK
jgi:hypothetical protein